LQSAAAEPKPVAAEAKAVAADAKTAVRQAVNPLPSANAEPVQAPSRTVLRASATAAVLLLLTLVIRRMSGRTHGREN
jgi:hypothetical protein